MCPRPRHTAARRRCFSGLDPHVCCSSISSAHPLSAWPNQHPHGPSDAHCLHGPTDARVAQPTHAWPNLARAALLEETTRPTPAPPALACSCCSRASPACCLLRVDGMGGRSPPAPSRCAAAPTLTWRRRLTT
eukprot:354859-Chlamydomonas_euryale.AAC.4